MRQVYLILFVFLGLSLAQDYCYGVPDPVPEDCVAETNSLFGCIQCCDCKGATEFLFCPNWNQCYTDCCNACLVAHS